MPVKIQLTCPLCGKDKLYFDEGNELETVCDICAQPFEADSACKAGHHICHMCRQKHARAAIMAHCLASTETQPYPLMQQLMQLPDTAMHGPEHHLLLTAALITCYCNEKGTRANLPDWLAEANERSLEVPGGACGFWGICGAAIGSGIYVSIVTEASPFAEDEWKLAGQLTALCAHSVSGQGGPRCCKRDSFLSFTQAADYSNAMLGTHFKVPGRIRCEYYPNNEDCKKTACPFFPKKKQAPR